MNLRSNAELAEMILDGGNIDGGDEWDSDTSETVYDLNYFGGNAFFDDVVGGGGTQNDDGAQTRFDKSLENSEKGGGDYSEEESEDGYIPFGKGDQNEEGKYSEDVPFGKGTQNEEYEDVGGYYSEDEDVPFEKRDPKSGGPKKKVRSPWVLRSKTTQAGM